MNYHIVFKNVKKHILGDFETFTCK